MQEKKNKRLLILLVTLLSVTAGALWLTRRDAKVEVEPNLFNNYDLQSVDGLKLERGSENISLTYNGTRWRVNKEFIADPAMIEVLFATVQQARPKRPLPVSMQDSVTQKLKREGTKVSVLAAGEVLQTFYAGGDAAKTQAYFVRENEAVPYLMNIPGYRVYVSGIFELGESGWRDKRIFTLNWRNFENLQAKFPKRPADDFTFALVDQFISIPGMNAVDTTQINSFMDVLLSLGAAEFVPANTRLDSLEKVSPMMTISIKDVAGKLYDLSLYPPFEKSGKFYGLIDKKQWAIFDRESISPLVRPRSSFGK